MYKIFFYIAQETIKIVYPVNKYLKYEMNVLRAYVLTYLYLISYVKLFKFKYKINNVRNVAKYLHGFLHTFFYIT